MHSEGFGRYQIIGELGRGGMATVFHAYDPEFDRPVSIKVLPPQFLHDPDFQLRFRQEARTIAALEHPGIVPVYDFGEHEGQPYLVMRYMGGGSLSDRLTKGPLSLQEVVHITDQIAPAIDHAHLRGIIHRDLKPANILFDSEGHAVVADFGIAKLLHASEQLTASGAVVGTAAYMSPEQIQATTTLDGRSDVYSLGVLLFEALAGRNPFVPNSPVGYFAAHLNEPVPAISTINPGLPPALDAVMGRVLAKNRDERHQTAGDLASDLRALTTGETASVLTGGGQGTRQQAPGGQTEIVTRRPGILAWIGGGILLLGIVVVLMIVQGKQAGGLPRGGQGVGTETAVEQAPASPTPEQTAQAVEAPTRTPTPSLRDLMPAELRSSLIVFSSDMSDPDILNSRQSRAQYNEIYSIRADGSRLTRLTVNEASDRQPSWSPDGSQIVFASNRDEGDWEIYVMDADGLNQTRLTDSPGDDTDPDWSPDGTRIAFVSTRDGNPELYVMDADGSNMVRLTDNPARDEWPNWSPDSTGLLFQSSRARHYEIFTYDLVSGEIVQLTRDDINDSWQPAWSPDGERVVYSGISGDSSPFGIGKYSLGLSEVIAGRIPQWFTPPVSPPTHAAWSPDGKWIVANYGVRFEWDWRSLIVVAVDGFGSGSPTYFEILAEPGEHKEPDWSWAP